VISLDRLLYNPEQQIRRICDWLGVEFDTAMLEGPRHNHLYPEQEFRSDRAADTGNARYARPAVLAPLQARYETLLARAL
jgi:hypothetical protein